MLVGYFTHGWDGIGNAKRKVKDQRNFPSANFFCKIFQNGIKGNKTRMLPAFIRKVRPCRRRWLLTVFIFKYFNFTIIVLSHPCWQEHAFAFGCLETGCSGPKEISIANTGKGPFQYSICMNCFIRLKYIKVARSSEKCSRLTNVTEEIDVHS